jgi:hypothetical protein
MRIQPSALLTLAIVCLCLAACDRGATETAKAEAPPPSTAPALGEDTAGAEAFVRTLFAAYSHGGPEDHWSAATEALMDAEEEALGGMIGYLDADPICSCQDFWGFRITSLVVTATGTDGADAAVTFVAVNSTHAVNSTQSTAENLKLVRENGAWKVDDIVYGEGHSSFGQPPLKQGLAASIAELRAEGGGNP